MVYEKPACNPAPCTDSGNDGVVEPTPRLLPVNVRPVPEVIEVPLK
jgi:hypothetical protein